MLNATAIRQVVVALTIAVVAATVHGAWFAPTAATREGAPVAQVRLSTWDHYAQQWVSRFITEGETVRNYESDIIELRSVIDGVNVASAPAALNLEPIADLNALGIPAPLETPLDQLGNPVPGLTASGTPVYYRLAVSELSFQSESRPGTLPANEPWAGPVMPTEDDLSATDVNGSVGVHSVMVSDSGGTVSYTWDVGRWAKGDVIMGLNNHTYKVIDRDGNFKRFIASADYTDPYPGEYYNATTGCATNWSTGEIFATNFADIGSAVNVFTRHPQGVGASLYAPSSRRIITRITRPDDPSTEYGIDISPESVAFDSDLNVYVGHSLGNFGLAPAEWSTTTGDQGEGVIFAEGYYFTMATDGKPIDSASENESWGYVVDETGQRLYMAVVGSAPGDYLSKIYGVESSPRLAYSGGQLIMDPASASAPGLPDWPALLPRAFYSDPNTGTLLDVLSAPGVPVNARWPMGKRVHRYNIQGDGTYIGSEAGESNADRQAFWNFTGRQGTDWIDLDVTSSVIYYTSEDSYVHRYRVRDLDGPGVGEDVGQLPDLGGGRLMPRPENGPSDRRFHGLRILPPGDGSGGYLVVGGDAIFRFKQDGVYVQQYQVTDDPYLKSVPVAPGEEANQGLVLGWYTIEVDPGGQTFWASAHDSGWVYLFDIASGRELRRLKAVEYAPLGSPGAPEGRRVEGICVMWEYTAPQEVCFQADGVTPDGVDDDGDGFVDENCTAIEICSFVSPGDDDGDGLPDNHDPDCGADEPPTAADDYYVTDQDVSLSVPSGGAVIVLDNDSDPDNEDETTPLLHDIYSVSTVGTAATTDPAGTAVATSEGGQATLLDDGSFVYVPAAGFHGTDTFVYRISDGANESNLATVNIVVRPRVMDDSYTTPEQTTLEVALVDGILGNDSSAPMVVSAAGADVITSLGGNPSIEFTTNNGGAVTLNSDGTFTYVPAATFVDTDTFVYLASDGTSDSVTTATVTIVVEGVNEVTAVNDGTFDTPYETPIVRNLLINDSDPENDPFGIIAVNGQAIAVGGTVAIANGTVRLDAADGTVTITPDNGFWGTLTFTYTIEDQPSGALGPVTATATVTVNVAKQPIVPRDDFYVTQQNTPLAVPSGSYVDILTNDDGSALVVHSLAIGGGGSVSLAGQPVTIGTPYGGHVTVYPNGHFDYTPAHNFVGVDSFRYFVWDAEINAVKADVYITVTPVSSTVTVTSPDPSVYGSPADVFATVTCGSDQAPSVGTVTFLLGSSVIAAGVPVVNGVATTTLPASLVVGNYTITAQYSGAATGDPICPASEGSDGHQVVVPLVVTADDKTKPYDGTVYSPFTVAYSGFVGGDDAGDLGGALTFSGAATTAVNVGTQVDGIVPAGYTSANYTITYQPGALTITPVPAVVRANDKTIYVGDPLPVLDGVWTGLVVGESATATYATTAVDSNTVGTYPITPTPDDSPVLANYIVTVIPGTLTILPRSVPCTATGYVTYSQGGWGSRPRGGNPGALLAANFSAVYPGGVAQIGGIHKLTFTSASAIEKYLPAGGSAEALSSSTNNPTKSEGVLSAQLLALQLAADFSRAGVLQTGLGNMVMQSGPLAGQTVDAILAMANDVFGGNTSALPTGMSLSGLSSLLESIIMNYHEGSDGGMLACGDGTVTPPPPTDPPSDPPPSTGSGVCEGGVTKLVLKYIGSDSPNGVVRGRRTAPGNGPTMDAQVSGSTTVLYTFAIEAMGGVFDPVAGGRLANEFTVFIGNTAVGGAHTSCSVPIYPGMKIGDLFEIVEVWTRGGGLMGPQ
jgi:hypothetical protein